MRNDLAERGKVGHPPIFFEALGKPPSPYINRFISADTIVPGYANPQNLNRYSYVTNNPLRYTDPTGHRLVENEGGGGCSTSGYCPGGTPPQTPNNPPGGGGGGNNNDGEDNGGGGGFGGGSSGAGSEEDTGLLTSGALQFPGTAEDWSNLATGLDVLAWFTDLYAAGVVTYAFLVVPLCQLR